MQSTHQRMASNLICSQCRLASSEFTTPSQQGSWSRGCARSQAAIFWLPLGACALLVAASSSASPSCWLPSLHAGDAASAAPEKLGGARVSSRELDGAEACPTGERVSWWTHSAYSAQSGSKNPGAAISLRPAPLHIGMPMRRNVENAQAVSKRIAPGPLPTDLY